jgi:hypothetical protein
MNPDKANKKHGGRTFAIRQLQPLLFFNSTLFRLGRYGHTGDGDAGGGAGAEPS